MFSIFLKCKYNVPFKTSLQGVYSHVVSKLEIESESVGGYHQNPNSTSIVVRFDLKMTLHTTTPNPHKLNHRRMQSLGLQLLTT